MNGTNKAAAGIGLRIARRGGWRPRRRGARLDGGFTKRVCGTALLVASLAAACGVRGADTTALITPEHFATGRAGGRGTTAEAIMVQGQPFARAQRVTTQAAAGEPYAVQMDVKTLAAASKGDVCLASLHARTVSAEGETGEGQLLFFFQKSGAPWTKSLFQLYSVPPTWTQFHVPFKIEGDYAAGAAAFALGFGAAKQSVEIADVKVVNYGQGYDLASLPRTTISYAGREPDAAWRAAAADRIERHRKAGLAVRVVDADGKAIPGAEVQVAMKRHAYHFGTAVYAPRWEQRSADGERYRQEILKNFNAMIIENSMKWQGIAGEWGAGRKETARQAMAWAKENGLATHGHVLVWPSKRFTPRPLQHLVGKENAAKLAETIRQHIQDTTRYFDPVVDEWQVVNELYGNPDYTDILGQKAVGEWFRTAHAAVPNVPLYINDYGIVSANYNDQAPHPIAYEKTIQGLLAERAPIGGIGMQSHFGSALTPPERVYAILERFGRFGLPIQATEFDVHARDEQVQADYTRDFLTVFFSHPATRGVIFWGFWEGQHWVPHAALVRKNWTYKPNMEAYRDLVFGKWWTDETGRAGANGVFATRGFLGEYAITASHGGKTTTQPLTLDAKGAKLQIVLK